MKHFVFRVSLRNGETEYSDPICGQKVGIVYGYNTTTDFEFTSCTNCQALIQKTLWEALGPKVPPAKAEEVERG